MTPDDAELIRLLLLLADGKGIGLPRVAARRLAELADQVERLTVELAATRGDQPGDEVCPVCARPLIQPATGRRRRFCSAQCRKTSSRETRRNAKVAA